MRSCRVADEPWHPGFDLFMDSVLQIGSLAPLASDAEMHVLKVWCILYCKHIEVHAKSFCLRNALQAHSNQRYSEEMLHAWLRLAGPRVWPLCSPCDN